VSSIADVSAWQSGSHLTSDALVAELPKEEKKAGVGGGEDLY
jgi:hypothetical protein